MDKNDNSSEYVFFTVVGGKFPKEVEDMYQRSLAENNFTTKLSDYVVNGISFLKKFLPVWRRKINCISLFIFPAKSDRTIEL